MRRGRGGEGRNDMRELRGQALQVKVNHGVYNSRKLKFQL